MPQLQIFLSEESQFTTDLVDEKITIGRLADNSLHLDDGSVSSHHAELLLVGSEYHLHDLGSTNGTYVNDDFVQDVILRHGDQLRFGRVEAVYVGEVLSEDQPLPETAAIAAQVAQVSARPANFVCTSPILKTVSVKDPASTGILAFGGVAVLGFLIAVVSILMMHAP